MNEYEVIVPGSGTYIVESDKELTEQEAYKYAKQQADEMTAGERVTRGLGIAARASAPTLAGATAGGAVAGPPGALVGSMAVPAGDILNTALNIGLKSMGIDYQFPMASQSIQNLMTKAGVPGAPETQSASERIASTGLEALVSTGKSLAPLQRLATDAGTVGGREVAKIMSEAPIQQLTVAPVAAGAGQAVTEATQNPLLGLLTSVGTGAAGGLKPTKQKEVAPSQEQLAQISRQGYEDASEAGVLFGQKALKNAGDKIVNRVSSEIVIDPDVDKEAVAVINRLQKTFDRPQTLEELDLTRQFIRSASKNSDRSGQFAKKALKEFDEYIDNIKPEDLVGAGDAKKANQFLKNARDAWKRKNKVQAIEDMMSSADLRQGNYSQSGYENAIRRQLINLADSDELRFFSKEEQKAIIAAAKGGPVQNVLRYLGRLSPSGVVSMGLGSYIGSEAFGPYGAVIGPAMGFGAKKGAEALSLAQINALRDMMALGRKPEVIAGRARAVPAMAARGLLNAPDDSEQQYQWRVAD